MTCSACTSSVESALSQLPGVSSVAVSLATETCKVEFDRTLVGPRDLVERVEELGFDAVLAADEEDATQLRSLTRTKEIHEWRDRFRAALAFAIPVFFTSMIAWRIPFLAPIVGCRIMRGVYVGDMICLILTTPVQFWLGRRFYRAAWKSVRHGGATMDVLVVLGTTAAYVYSVFAIAFATQNENPSFHPAVFFDTSTMLIMFVSLGRYLENRAKGKTSAALTDLMALAPSMATIYTDAPACTTEKKIATELVQVGDTVKLVPGDRVPADGTVVRGSSSVDESAVTGEPIPVLKQIGDSVIGGTVNGLGTLDMVVIRAGKDTALSQIVRLVEDAQTSKAPIQAFADRVAGLFVPTVISLSLITFLAWMIISNFILTDSTLPDVFRMPGQSKLSVCLKLCISVVVVACPCALGLATPTAIMVGTGVGAKNGILIKGGRALEASKSVQKVVLDKTGTVTEGTPSVVSIAWASSHNVGDVQAIGGSAFSTISTDGVSSRADVLALVAAAEARSEHPLARAVATYGHETLKGLEQSTAQAEVKEFESVTGAGVKATIVLTSGANKRSFQIFVGSASFVSQAKDGSSSLPSTLSSFEAQESDLSRTVIFASLASTPSSLPQPVVALSLSDKAKPSAAYAIRALQAMGIDVAMMTGDGESTAQAVAREVGIPSTSVWSRVSPKGKAKIIEDLKKDGTCVAMVRVVLYSTQPVSLTLII
jgi:Cu+-exporting ATPase